MAAAIAPAGVLIAVVAIMFLLVLYYTLTQISGSTRGLPLIGPQFAQFVDGIAGAVYSWALWVAARLIDAIVWGAQTFNAYVNWIAGGIVSGANAVISTVTGTVLAAQALLNLTIARLDGAWNYVVGQVVPRVAAVEGHAAHLQTQVDGTWSWILGHVDPNQGFINDQLRTATATAARTIGSLQTQVRVQAGQIGDAQVRERVLTAQLEQVQTDLRAAQTAINGLIGTAVKVAPLVAAGALTAAEGANLRKLADDPCYCMNAGDGAGLQELAEETYLVAG